MQVPISTKLSILDRYLSHYRGLSFLAWRGIGISFIESCLIGSLYFLSIYFVAQLHLSIAIAGTLLSSFGLGTIIGSIVAGKLSDQFSPRMVTIVSLILQSIAYFLLIQFHATQFLFINLFILGIGSYGFITSNHTWTLGCCQKDERLKVISMLDISSNLGLAISGIVIGFIPINHFHDLFILSSCFLCLIAIYIFLFTQNDLLKTEVVDDSKYFVSGNSIIKYYTLSCLFLVGLIISQTSSTYPIYLQKSFPGMGTTSFSILFTLNATIIVLFQAPILNSLAKQNKTFIVGLGASLLGWGMMLLNFSNFFTIAIVSCLITTLGEILFFSTAQLICYERSPAEKKGHALGMYRMVYAASRIVGPALGGVVYQQIGSQSLWSLCFLLGVLCLVPSLYLCRLI